MTANGTIKPNKHPIFSLSNVCFRLPATNALKHVGILQLDAHYLLTLT